MFPDSRLEIGIGKLSKFAVLTSSTVLNLASWY